MQVHHVDIVIPIYNAYEDLEKCIDSIYKNTDLTNNRLILVNDNSSDNRIKEFLDRQSGSNIIVIHNQTNRGFSHNVNLGMAQSETNDVLLLNSDTIVTKGWIEKMVRCAYSDGSIGTVTPLSNNATLCSVPVFCEENMLPENMTVQEAADIVERVSLRKYPFITVAHGFCMLIKREVIDAIGDFDEKTFEKGYGEENDFCNRAGQLGYRHVMCDDTYILHTGTKSFISSEKAKLIAEHDRILRERYPSQMHDNDVHVRDNPNSIISKNVGIFFDLNNGRKNILYVVQADFRADAEDNVGGTQLHVKNLTHLMKNDYNVFVAARDREYLNLTLYIDNKIHSWRFYIGESPDYYPLMDRELRKIWERIIDTFRIDIVHVHHLLKTSFDVVEVAKSRKLQVIFTLHDYFMVCPSEKLLNEHYEYITAEGENENMWKKWLREKNEIIESIDYIGIWRKRAKELLNKCDLLIVPNKAAADIVVSYYPDLMSKLKVQPHGYEFEEVNLLHGKHSDRIRSHVEKVYKEGNRYRLKGWAVCGGEDNTAHNIYIEIQSKNKGTLMVPSSAIWRDDISEVSGNGWSGFDILIPDKYVDCNIEVRPFVLTGEGELLGDVKAKKITAICKTFKKDDKLNVAFIGGINIEKGGNLIYDVVANKKSNANWYVFGDIGARKLKGLKNDSLCKYGRYHTEDLPRLLDMNNIDVVCIMSIWPETYSYTLSEALLCDKLVVVTDTGALGQRVKPYTPECCISVENAAQELLNLMDRLSVDRDLIQRLKEKQKGIEVLSVAEMAEQYKSIYKVHGGESAEYGAPDYRFIADSMRGNEDTTAAANDGFRQEFKRRLRRYIKHMPSKIKYKLKHMLSK